MGAAWRGGIKINMFPKNVFPETAEVNSQGCLTIGGCDLTDLANDANFGTPLYIFDEETLRDRCRQFTREFRSRHQNTTVVYACKAYINPALAQIFIEEGLGLDVVSGGEMAVAKAVDFPPPGSIFPRQQQGQGGATGGPGMEHGENSGGQLP